ncbi:hypothetical protein [Mycobacterium sp.]|uniref:hypothetical protein n=1 Tax=Mycobacterium sp. TaxID=1785 RepID=UPI003A888000
MTPARLRWPRATRGAAVTGVVVGAAMLCTAPLSAPRAKAGEPTPTPFVQVRIDQVTPDVVTTSSDPLVTVTGTVTSIGDRPVRDVMVRLEHAPAVASSIELRTTLDNGADDFEPAADVVAVAPELKRGQQARFVLSAPLRPSAGPSLRIDGPGVFPILVNVNGTPDYGAPSRLTNARFLLPVVGVPPGEGLGIAAAVAPETTKPVWITMLWPLADRPRLAPGVPGGTVPVRLVDDELAASLDGGGRLDALLASAELATSRAVDPDGAVNQSLCLAVDPDLLVTVNAMTAGYVVSDATDGPAQLPGTPTHPGTGQAAANLWLNRLRALAKHTCVVALPYAQADLDALQRVANPGLRYTATASPADIVDRILDVASLRGTAVLPDGPLTDRTVTLLDANDDTVAVAAADPAPAGAAPIEIEPRRLSARVVVAPFDPAVGAALAAAGTNPIVPAYLDKSLSVGVNRDSATARRQDALGAILWRSLSPEVSPRTELLVPPGSWTLRADDAQSILTALATAIHSGLAVPRPLPALIADAPTHSGQPDPPGGYPSARGQFDSDVVGRIAEQTSRLQDLTSALMTDERTGLTGAQYTAPLLEDMLRTLSRSVPPDARDDLAQQRLSVTGKTIDDIFRSVTIVEPSGSYTLATEHSPLPLVLHNGLTVPIRVRLQISAPPGMTVTDLGEIELTPGYLPLRVPIEVNFTQRVAIDVGLSTPDGTALGEPARLSVHSNAYGQVLFAITMTAAAILVLLTGRRLWHRFRGQPDRADLDRLGPATKRTGDFAGPPGRQFEQPHPIPHRDAHRRAADDRIEEEHRV